MTQSYYSWCGTRVHLILDDEVATAYNKVQDAFKDAQLKFKAEYGTPWDPTTQPLYMENVTDEELEHRDKVAKLINLLIEVNGGGLDITEEELTSEYLVKL
jgi:hypothetical protein